MKKAILYIFIFLVVGEIMVRFDETFILFEESRVVKIAANIELTPEYQLLVSDSFIVKENDLRIMILGDSYIYGGGIEFKDNFSQNLRKMFKNKPSDFDNVWILDISKPSANNLDHYLSYFNFAKKFQPTILILGYNLNDLEGNLDKTITNSPELENFKENIALGYEKTSSAAKLYRIVKYSHFLHFTVHNLHKKLKARGFVLPGSRFDQMLKSYTENKENWKKSQLLLSEIIEHAIECNTQVVIYKYPEINLIEHPHLFYSANDAIVSYFKQYPSVVYREASDLFAGEKPCSYVLSKYDGHPNEKAHKIMAEDAFRIVNERETDFSR